MEKKRIILKLEDFFRKNALQYRINVALLYGSWAAGHPHEESDIDLGILFSRKIVDQDKMFHAITDVSYKLEKELNREVNVISISRDFPQPMLYYNVITSGIPLFIKNYDEFLDLRLNAVCQMEDFRIFGIAWQRRIAEKLI